MEYEANHMENIPPVVIVAVLAILFAILITRRVVTIFEYQRGLLYGNGKFRSILNPGRHAYLAPWQSVQKVDIRTQYITLPGQEVLSADNVSLKISLVAGYKIVDPYLAINQVVNHQEALYLTMQLDLRDVIGALEVDDLLAKRQEIGTTIHERSAKKAAGLGLELELVNLKDIMFPGELKNIFAQVVNARKEGLAALERARGESAALRNLANAAKLLDGNPNLYQLRFLQTLEGKSGNTIVVLGEGVSSLNKALAKSARSSAK
jgi:regulator of protease activity HflC (stomatin/prohibitin superfamily)